jgi:hypothetical protein
MYLLGSDMPKRSVPQPFFVSIGFLISKLPQLTGLPPSAFSATTRSKLSPLPSGPASLSLQAQLHEQIATFPGNLASLAVSKHHDLDTEGLTLWNLSTRLMRSKDFPVLPDQRATLLAARVFAFLLLDGGLSKGNSSLANVSRLMKIALKAAKGCIGRPHTESKGQYILMVEI